MKSKKIEKIRIYFGITVIILLIIGIFTSLFNKPSNIQLDKGNKEEKSKLHKGLEIGLVILVIILVILGLFIGFRKMQLAEQEQNRKKYLRVDKELDDEYKLSYHDNVYYLKKGDLK